MSMITLFSAFMGLYVIVRLILPSGMNWPFKLILSLFALACAEKLLLTKLVYGTMGAFMPEPMQPCFIRMKGNAVHTEVFDIHLQKRRKA